MAGSLKTFIDTVKDQGGFSISNNFDLEFNFNSGSQLINRLSDGGIKFGNDTSSGTLLKILCDEAQLPNIQAATGQITGRFLGEGQINYPHTKLYSDFQLGWLCDANMLPLKFLNLWYGFIFQDYDTKGKEIKPTITSGKSLDQLKGNSGALNNSNALLQKSVRLNYPEDYMCNIVITKTERGAKAPNERASISYTMIDAFPYAIDAVPMSYGASQITKVTANFYYAKHSVVYNKLK